MCSIDQSIKILEEYNNWRSGAEIPMQEPRQITNAINKAVEVMKEYQKHKTNDLKNK